MTRILLALLHVTEVAHVADDLLYAVDPQAGQIAARGNQVQVLSGFLEDDGEAVGFLDRERVFNVALSLAAETQGVDLIDGDWSS